MGRPGHREQAICDLMKEKQSEGRVVRIKDLSLLTPKPEKKLNSSIIGKKSEILQAADARSSAKGKYELHARVRRKYNSGSYAMTKRRGDNGHPCLTPRSI